MEASKLGDMLASITTRAGFFSSLNRPSTYANHLNNVMG